ncbi:MAG: hypothetical protein JWO02_116 [Solirubrobacterales bacterium]|nr:hypothetical protein [Solirubrobacterales bacterium]
MENEDWHEIVTSLVNAKRHLRNAGNVLDGTDGTADGVEYALSAATSAIDAIYAIEALAGLFGAVLGLCAQAGLAKVGIVAIDGTTIYGLVDCRCLGPSVEVACRQSQV